MILLLVGALAAGLRLAHLTTIRGTAFYHFDESWTSSDMHANRSWAQHIAAGDWLDRNAYRPHFSWQDNIADPATWERWLGPSTYYQPPLYAYLAALSIRGTGSPDALRFLQTLLGAVNVILIGLLGRRVAGPAAGLIAALLTAGYAPFILYDSELLRGTFVITLSTLTLLALLRAGREGEFGKRVGFILAGSLLGIAYLLESAIVTFIPLAFVWAYLSGQDATVAEASDVAAHGGEGSRSLQGPRSQQGQAPARTRSGPPGPARLPPRSRAAWLAAGLVAALFPLFVRNAIVGAPLLSSTTRAPLTFVMGNAPGSSPVGAAIPESAASILAASDYRFGATILETLRAHGWNPGSLLSQQWEKLSGLFNNYEVPDNPSFYYAALVSPVLALGLRFSCVSGLGLVGLLIGAKRWRDQALLYLYVAGVLGVFVLAHVVSRYRQPLVAPLAIFAGAALVEAWRAFAARRVAVAAGILVGGVALSFALPATPPPGYRFYRPAEFLIAAERLESEGDVTRAGAEIRNAIGLALKENAPVSDRISLGNTLGALFHRHRRFPEALSAYRDVLEEDPANGEALIATGGINHDTNQPIEALALLLRAEAVVPDNAEVEARLGHLLWVTFHDGPRALPHLKKALALAPNSPVAANLSLLATQAAAAPTTP